MIEMPHFAWPIRLQAHADGTVGFAMVEQDTPDDLLASAAVIASTPRGHRDDDPTFGVTNPLFSQGPIDADQYAAELAEADPRLDVDAEETIELTDAMRRKLTVSVGRAG